MQQKIYDLLLHMDTERIRCLRRIMEGRPVTVVTTFSALMTP